MSNRPTSAESAWWQLTPRRLLAALLPLSLFVLAAQPQTDPDLWWHLRTGQWILENHTIPHGDPFSFTMLGAHWVAHEWLADIGLYLLYQAGGLTVLSLATALIVSATFMSVYFRSELRPHAAVFTTLLAALAAAAVWGPRPATLTMLFSALTLSVLRRARTNRLWLWSLPAMFLLWANVHSGFFLGLAIIAACLAGEIVEQWLARHSRALEGNIADPELDSSSARRVHAERSGPLPIRALTLALVLSIVASTLNPNGAELLAYPFFTLTSRAMQTYIVEWHSPDFHDVRFLPLAALLLLLILSLALSKRRPHATELILLLGLGYESLVSLRNIPLFGIVAAPVLSGQIAALLAERLGPALNDAGSPQTASVRLVPRPMLLLNWTLLAVFILVALARIVSAFAASDPVAKEFPVLAADYLLTAKPAGPLLNSYNFGGYLIWRLYPNYPVFIDGRADVYGDAFMDEYYNRMWLGHGDWQEYLNRFKIRLVLMEKYGALSSLLRGDAGWKIIHEDDVATLFQRLP
jgi:hypothetical protein